MQVSCGYSSCWPLQHFHSPPHWSLQAYQGHPIKIRTCCPIPYRSHCLRCLLRHGWERCSWIQVHCICQLNRFLSTSWHVLSVLKNLIYSSFGLHIWNIVWPVNQRGSHAVIGEFLLIEKKKKKFIHFRYHWRSITTHVRWANQLARYYPWILNLKRTVFDYCIFQGTNAHSMGWNLTALELLSHGYIGTTA